MKLFTRYEWIAEEVAAETTESHEEGDIDEVSHFETAIEMLRYIQNYPAKTGFRYQFGLVKDRLDDTDDLIERSWAYVDENGVLPSEFCDGSADAGKVPLYLKREFERA